MTEHPHEVTGVCPVVQTPFDRSGAADVDSLARLIEHLGDIGVSSVMYPGLASETIKLSEDERDDLTAVVLERAHASRIRVVASVSEQGTLPAIRRVERLVGLGADAINLLPPPAVGTDPGMVRRHVAETLRAAADRPAILQIAPLQTGSSLDVDAIAELADGSPNLMQVKVEAVPAGRMIAAIRERTRLSCLVGYAGVQLIDAMRRGAVGVQPGCSFAELYLRCWDSWVAGDTSGAVGLHQRMLPYLSYWMQEVELIIAAEKRISAQRGLIGSDHCRTPARLLDREESKLVDRFLTEFATELPD